MTLQRTVATSCVRNERHMHSKVSVTNKFPMAENKQDDQGKGGETNTTRLGGLYALRLLPRMVQSSWNVMAHGDAQKGKWGMEWVASTLHTTTEHGVPSITTITIADAHTSAASSRLNWRPCRFKWTRQFRRKTKSGFCACAITFQTQSSRQGRAIHWQQHKAVR
jgi:hypothetical protein